MKTVIVTFAAAASLAAVAFLLGANIARSENFSITIPGIHQEAPRGEWRDRDRQREEERGYEERKHEEEMERYQHKHRDENRR